MRKLPLALCLIVSLAAAAQSLMMVTTNTVNGLPSESHNVITLSPGQCLRRNAADNGFESGWLQPSNANLTAWALLTPGNKQDALGFPPATNGNIPWSHLSSVPAGFADGLDDNVDLVTSNALVTLNNATSNSLLSMINNASNTVRSVSQPLGTIGVTNLNGATVTNLWGRVIIFTNLATGIAPTIPAPNGSTLIQSNGNHFTRTNATWVNLK